ncbi:YdeI/OmpD-associated family protein [Marinoscillum furvescens]|uniref:Bacteriocin resistance YdeI/OmpD-like protein n=1 Tax=Marinoscillum furvescens DSM 4134 TaxID=1122208 RepID=A0A3D9L5L8_MARFU|nr:YdeI/OmpD-associated family protein [Marinoscillum furvescens]RED98893.1 bacteriocin resistance YdeI/OmpD-like protein [Marinoscillum furvescens DSM 4134]
MNYQVDREARMERFSGKGGWTYVHIPEIAPDPHAAFGWVTVSGTIDQLPITKRKLMPKGDGTLFLAVKAADRKKLKKEVGDHVVLKLYIDEHPEELTQELLECFAQEPPELLERFHHLNRFMKKTYLDQIYSAKTEEAKAERILKMLRDLEGKG